MSLGSGFNGWRERSRRRAKWRTFGAGVVGAAAVGGLVFGVNEGVKATVNQSSNREAAAWTLDEEYFDCLNAQAHHLVHDGEHVSIVPNPSPTLIKVLAPFTRISNGTRYVSIGLQQVSGDGTCKGVVVVARYPSGLELSGKGVATLRTSRQLPQTPL